MRDQPSSNYLMQERVLRYARELSSANPNITNRLAFAETFVGVLSRPDASGNRIRNDETISGYLKTLLRFNMVPGHFDEAEETIRTMALNTAVTSAGKTRMRNVVREKKGNEAIWEPVTASMGYRRRNDERELEYRCCCYLMLATGNRAAHLVDIQGVRIHKGLLTVDWTRRKKRRGANTGTEYDLSLSRPPPPDVRARLVKKPWRSVAGGRNRIQLTAAINGYLKARARRARTEQISTSYYRRRMTTIMLDLRRSKAISDAYFKEALDHEEETSHEHYRLRDPPSSLLLPASPE